MELISEAGPASEAAAVDDDADVNGRGGVQRAELRLRLASMVSRYLMRLPLSSSRYSCTFSNVAYEESLPINFYLPD